MMQTSVIGRIGHALLIAMLYLFLLAPVIPVFFMSFTNDPYIMFPPESWGVKWYYEMWNNESFYAATKVSLIVGVIVTVIAILIGLPAAYALARLPVFGREFLLAFFMAPLIVPAIVLGLGLLLVFAQHGILGSYIGLTFAHTILVVPYVIRIAVTAFATLPADVEAAAATLGATPWQVFRRVTLPMMSPAIFGAAGLSFLMSFDEVAVSLFIVGSGVSTLPVTIFRYTQDHTDPQIAAVSVVLIIISAIIVFALERTVGLMKSISR